MPMQYSRLNGFRINNSRLNYLKIPKPLTGIWLWRGGAWVDYSAQARVASATVTQALNEVPDTATIRFAGTVSLPLKGQQIPIEARIITVADVYDALTSDRPYRKAMSPFDAKDILVKGSGTDFDPQVIEAFLEALKRGEMEVAAVQV